jgi:hypothetical protein
MYLCFQQLEFGCYLFLFGLHPFLLLLNQYLNKTIMLVIPAVVVNTKKLGVFQGFLLTDS